MSATRVEEDWKQALAFVSEPGPYLVVSHLHPDGDAIGSTLAVGWILKRLGKQVVMVNESPVPDKFRFLPEAERILSPDEAGAEGPYRRVIAVDVADRERMGSVCQLLAAEAEVLNIDHHPTNDRFGTTNLVIPGAAATAEILCHWSRRLQVEWDRELATCLYTGLLTDTGGFRYANTTPEVMELASGLLRHGVEPGAIADRVIETMTRGQLALLRRALDTLTFSDDGQVGWIKLTREDFRSSGAREEDLDGIVNYARNVAGVDVGILFRETDGQGIKVSLRSREIVDVGKLAQSMGGGGHARAAGCSLTGTLDEAEKSLLEQVKAALDGREG
ncbi:bifunctional oligoribonuclease/PAP phosphatase NrnA [Kroppenstedtia eburnea]|uniref:Phosphoesterase RecJ domain-containing protein n=1 Tax=Kroppenstedtia eburnea TaxID=714067 RepID=A0A1N7IVB3_9BACL|nr:bifunctional oligoribonuclease/PAP phosphatase NrnA [Kroppenstedtia eburnea]QKI82235.1 bifunctional oligoribonuclease/PAP phosphatase NrnA [Kroppenstedtia eburnea]SIS41032.1 phosphoesterase RecJ domain-containing protein [Kroppenstedtia eburnea]